jgi:4-aminobutyrate aminotransferase-like enzyme
VLPPGYLQALKQHCERRGALLIVDEAQTGLGRTGTMFAFQDHGIVPDILTLSKPLANGLPLSAVVVSAEINSIAKENGFLFFTTHANDPLVAAVGNMVIEIVLRDDLASNAIQRGDQLLCGLRRLQDKHSFIGDVRGRGLMLGVEIVAGNSCKDHDTGLASRLSTSMMKSGLWCQLQSGAVFRIGPPINCTPEEIENGLRILDEVFSTV